MMKIVNVDYIEAYDDVNQSNAFRLSVTIDVNGVLKNCGIDLLLSDEEIASGSGTSTKLAEQFRQMANYIESME